MPPANWATGAWCSLQASILPPPTYQIGALPNELRERIGLEPSPGLEPGSPPYKSGAPPQCFEGDGASRRNQTSGLRFTRAALCRLSYASLVGLAETRAVGRSYGSRGALMLREHRP